MQTRLLPQSQKLPLGRVALVWLVLSAILILANLPNITGRQFPDPDDTLRLVEVRDFLSGQGWFDLHQYRIDPPAGTAMHWSRLVDLPLALVIVLFQPLLGQAGAEAMAMVLVPLFTLGAILLAVGKVAARHFDSEVVGLACLSCGMLPLLVAQVQPNRIDHHGWQIVAVALALIALLARSPRKGGQLAGLALAAGLSISIELLPFAAGFAGVLFLRWLENRQERGWLVHYMTALAGGLVALFVLTRGLADLAPWCDAIAPAHLGFFLAAAVGTCGIARMPAMPRAALVLLFAGLGAAATGLFAVAAPACLVAPFGELDPLVRQYWYSNVLEGRPFWAQELATAGPSLAQALVAFAAAVHLWRNSEGAERRWWFDYLLLFGVTLLTGLMVWRSMAFAGVFSAIPIGWLAMTLFRRMRQARQVARRLTIALGIAVLLMPALPVMAAKAVLDWHRGPGVERSPVPLARSSCAINRHVELLKRLPAQTIFAPLDIGPAVLERTDHSVVATSHHRANLAMRDVILGFTLPEAQAREIVTAHGAQLVVVCGDLIEPQIYRREAPGGLMADLLAGRAPGWLKPVDIGGPEGLKVWRVVK